MNQSNIQPEQAWRMVLDQLHMEMSKGSFDSWVGDTVFVSFEDGTLTAGTTNTYACEWLTSRLTSTVNHMLTGILNQPVTVRFVVLFNEENELVEDDSVQDEKPGPDSPPKVITLQAEYQSIYDEIVQPEHVIVIPGYFLRYIPMLGLELSWLYIGFRQAAYEAGASKKPGKKVNAPAKKVAWYAGMSSRSFWRWAAKPTTWKLLGRLVKPVEEIPQWHHGRDGRPHQATRSYRVAMTIPLTPFDEQSLRSWLYRRLVEGRSPLATLQAALETPVDELLPWPEKMPFLEETGGKPQSIQEVVLEMCSPIEQNEQVQFNELAEKLAQHLMSSKDLIFLTHYFVSRWLPRLGAGPGWFVALMRDRCYLNQRTGEIRDEIRLDEGYVEAARWLGLKRVKTIWEWLRIEDVATFIRETGRGIGGWEEASRIFKICMSEPMIEADQDRANLILANRPVGAVDTHSSLDEGNPIGASVTHRASQYTDFIGAIGSDHPIGASVIHRTSLYTRSIGAIGNRGQMEEESAIGASVTHRKWEGEAPVGATDTHRDGFNSVENSPNSAVIGMGDGLTPFVEVNLMGQGDSDSPNGEENPIGASVIHSETADEAAIGASVTHRTGSETAQIGAIGTPIGASVIHRRGASDTHNGASVTIDWRNWHSLNSLTPGLKHLKNTETTSSAEGSLNSSDGPSEKERGVVDLQWNLKDLMTLNRVSQKNQELLFGKGLSAQAFISWLLYAASKNGAGIRDPIGHAVSRLVQDPTRGAGGSYDRLAGLPANELSELIKRELSGQSPWNTDWRTVMADTPRAKVRALADQLGVPVSDPNYW